MWIGEEKRQKYGRSALLLEFIERIYVRVLIPSLGFSGIVSLSSFSRNFSLLFARTCLQWTFIFPTSVNYPSEGGISQCLNSSVPLTHRGIIFPYNLGKTCLIRLSSKKHEVSVYSLLSSCLQTFHHHTTEGWYSQSPNCFSSIILDINRYFVFSLV